MTASTAGVVLSDLAKPVAGPPLTLAGPPVPPAQRIYFYPSGEWEEYIREWAQGLIEDYIQIKQLGGPGDQGIDVAAFKSEQGLEGPWDCFQGKHYTRELRPADAWVKFSRSSCTSRPRTMSCLTPTSSSPRRVAEGRSTGF